MWCFVSFVWIVFILFDSENSIFRCHEAPQHQKKKKKKERKKKRSRRGAFLIFSKAFLLYLTHEYAVLSLWRKKCVWKKSLFCKGIVGIYQIYSIAKLIVVYNFSTKEQLWIRSINLKIELTWNVFPTTILLKPHENRLFINKQWNITRLNV